VTPKMENMHVVPFTDGGWSAGFDMDGARYHVWFDPDTLVVEDTLYKNPPLGMKPDDKKFFLTRRLDCNAGTNRKLIAQLMDEVRSQDLIGKARAAERVREEAEVQALRARALRLQVLDAAPELYRALVDVASKLSVTMVGQDILLPLQNALKAAQGYATTDEVLAALTEHSCSK
jgi:hypothetical protein